MDFDSSEEEEVVCIEAAYDNELSELTSNFHEAIYTMKKTECYNKLNMDDVKLPLLTSITNWYKSQYQPDIPITKAEEEEDVKEEICQLNVKIVTTIKPAEEPTYNSIFKKLSNMSVSPAPKVEDVPPPVQPPVKKLSYAEMLKKT